MSVENAKAFCARMMSDEDYRNAVGEAASADAIKDLLKKEDYTFSKRDLLVVVSGLLNKEVKMEELSAMICEVYEEEI